MDDITRALVNALKGFIDLLDAGTLVVDGTYEKGTGVQWSDNLVELTKVRAAAHISISKAEGKNG